MHTWIASYMGSLKTTVYFDLEPETVHGLHPSGPRKAGTETRLKLRHEGFAGAPQQGFGHGEGWKRVMGWLQAYVGRGETVETWKSA